MPDPDDLRQLIESQTTPPRHHAKPDLGTLRALMDACPHGPWWLATHATPNGYPRIFGGILAASIDDVVSDNDAPHELGRLFPDLSGALAVAAVNALPWLLAAVDKADRGDQARRDYQAARNRYGPVAQANMLVLDHATFNRLPAGPLEVGDSRTTSTRPGSTATIATEVGRQVRSEEKARRLVDAAGHPGYVSA